MTVAPGLPGHPDGHHDDADRARIADQLDTTLFVEAGAGTGKTTALVGRIVELVITGGVPLTQIAAITFTEAAAAELRDRVSQTLERVALGLPAPGLSARIHAAADGGAQRRDRAAAALGEMGGAAITTLHGFARRLLVEHPFEVGLPPVIDVLDEVRSAVEFEDRWLDFRDRMLADPRLEDVLLRAIAIGLSTDQLRDLARTFDDNWDRVAEAQFVPPPLPTLNVDTVLDPLTQARALTHCCTAADDKLLVHLDDLAETGRQLSSTSDPLGRLVILLGSNIEASVKKGNKSNWGGRVDEVRALVEQAQMAAAAFTDGTRQAVLRTLMAEVAVLTGKAADDRRREGRLEFHDLLVLARDLLRRHDDVRLTLRDQYRHLLIDEFQDTDPIQAEMAFRLACAVQSGANPSGGDWRTLAIEPGRLFFVGDPKQSIYGFRRADIALFLEVRGLVENPPLALTLNRRSVPGIVAWVNAVFARLIQQEPGVQPGYQPLVAKRLPLGSPDDGPPVQLLGGPVDGANAEEIRRLESEEITEAIQVLIDRGRLVEDEAVDDGVRPVQLSDVTVLIPSRTNLPALETAFDQCAMAYQIVSSTLVYASGEVQDLMNVLRAIDDPFDEISIVAALRSPMFGCGDDDLLGYITADGRWDYRSDPPSSLVDVANPVVAGLGVLRQLSERRTWDEVSGLIERVIHQRRAVEIALDDRRFRDTWRRLRFIADQARLYTDAYGGDLRRYLQWAATQAEDNVRVNEAVLPETDNNAVRIMTVHASKGLEFPVVVLAGLGVKSRTSVGVQLHFDRFGSPEISINKEKRLRTAGFEDLKADASVREAAEGRRLLYVAATRARDQLLVSVSHKAGNTCAASAILGECELVPDLWQPFAIDPNDINDDQDAQPVAVGGEVDIHPDTPADRDVWLAGRAALMEDSAEPRVISATAAVQQLREPVPAEPDYDEGAEPGQWRRGRAATALGRAVHAVLQVADLEHTAPNAHSRSGDDGLSALALAAAAAEGVGDQVAEVERMARSAIGSDVVRRAVTGGRYWRELYVGAPVGNRVVEGFIDLLIEHPDGRFEVVDYKTDRLTSESQADTKVARYQPQGAMYALALEIILGRPIDLCTFIFLRSDVVVERTVPDLPAAKAEVRALLGGN